MENGASVKRMNDGGQVVRQRASQRHSDERPSNGVSMDAGRAIYRKMSSTDGEEFQKIAVEEEEVEVRSSGRSSCISSGQHDEIQSSNGSSDDCSQSEISLCDDGASELEEGDEGADDELGHLNECGSSGDRVNEDDADSQIMIGLGGKSNSGESYEDEDEAPCSSISS